MDQKHTAMTTSATQAPATQGRQALNVAALRSLAAAALLLTALVVATLVFEAINDFRWYEDRVLVRLVPAAVFLCVGVVFATSLWTSTTANLYGVRSACLCNQSKWYIVYSIII